MQLSKNRTNEEIINEFKHKGFDVTQSLTAILNLPSVATAIDPFDKSFFLHTSITCANISTCNNFHIFPLISS